MDEKIIKELQELVSSRNYQVLRTKFSDHNEVEIARFIESLPIEKATVTFRTLPKDMAVDVFAHLQTETQQHIIGKLTDQELNIIIEDLFIDDAVDILEELPANVVKHILKNANHETRVLINQFLNYNEDTAGSIMTAEFTDLRKNMTVGDAIKHIRRTGEDKETIYTCYVIDEQRILLGVVTVKNLLLSHDEEMLGDIMDTNIIKAMTTDDREDVANLFAKYGLLSIPIVDHENRLVGIVTVDDAVDVIQKETTEDIEKMAAILPSERPYLKTSIWTHSKNRITWLMVLMISGMITGEILGRYEHAFAALPLLVTFIPMLTDTGGNAGSQSSTLIIRGMALSEIKWKDFFKVLWKELRISLVVGVALSFVNFLRIIIMFPGNTTVAITVSIALFSTIVMAKTIGSVLPLLAKLIKVDPAIMAGPLITTIVDAFALVIYFSVAETLLGL